MEINKKTSFGPECVRADFIPATDYHGVEFANLERERLWPKVWQIVCRHEEIPEPGNFVTYDILDESIIVLRAADMSVKAFYNACPHRGRRLTTGCGKAKQLVCPFHAWRFDLAGKNVYVQDSEDWGDLLANGDVDLQSVRVESWGGWVFLNMDPETEPLEKFLAPVIERCGKYQFENLRFRWYKTVKLDCNWKIVLEAFNEGYHIAGTHPELLRYTEDYTSSKAYGPHAAMWHVLDKAPGACSSLQRSHKRGGVDPGEDYRQFLKAYTEDMDTELRAMVTGRSVAAARKVLAEVAPDTPQMDVMLKFMDFQRQAVEESGAPWPAELTPEYMAQSHQDWHVFPNTIFLHASVDGVLWYRSRPDPRDVNRCIFDVWSLELYPEGGAPELVRENYENWRDVEWGRILAQDFSNVEEVQRGIKSRGFRGARPNPKQEVAVSNFHRALRDCMSKD